LHEKLQEIFFNTKTAGERFSTFEKKTR